MIDTRCKERVMEVLASGHLTEGPVTHTFENTVKQFVGVSHCLATTSCTTGLEMALRAIGVAAGDEVIVPDYTYPATYIPEMLGILVKGYPVVIGSRLKGGQEKGALKKLNIVGNKLLTWMANSLYRSNISDLCTGFWGMRGEIIPNLELMADGFQLEAELFTQMSKKGYEIAELPTFYRCREGKAKLSGLKDGFKIGWMLIKKRF